MDYAYMNESLPLLASHLRISIAENEANSGEKVALPRAIATDNDIEFWREWVNNCLVLVAAGKVRRDREGRRDDSYLLKPCMVICLICIFSQVPLWLDQAMQNCAYVKWSKDELWIRKDATRDPANASPN
jgi:hypothetical protein